MKQSIVKWQRRGNAGVYYKVNTLTAVCVYLLEQNASEYRIIEERIDLAELSYTYGVKVDLKQGRAEVGYLKEQLMMNFWL